MKKGLFFRYIDKFGKNEYIPFDATTALNKMREISKQTGVSQQ
jgi:hypothetical protein